MNIVTFLRTTPDATIRQAQVPQTKITGLMLIRRAVSIPSTRHRLSFRRKTCKPLWYILSASILNAPKHSGHLSLQTCIMRKIQFTVLHQLSKRFDSRLLPQRRSAIWSLGRHYSLRRKHDLHAPSWPRTEFNHLQSNNSSSSKKSQLLEHLRRTHPTDIGVRTAVRNTCTLHRARLDVVPKCRRLDREVRSRFHR